MPKDAVVLFTTDEGKALVRKHCRAAGISLADLKELIELEAAQVGRQRKAGLWEQFEDVIDRMSEDN
jgi:DNA-binding transcriptional MerR regulator